VLERIERILKVTFPAAWVFLIALLPITSLPLMIRLVRSDMVGSPAALPLVWLFALWFVPYLLRRGAIPRVSLPLIGLAVVAIIASAGAYFIDIPRFKDISIFDRELRSAFTLCVGLGFYLVASTWPNTSRRFQLTLQILNFTGLIIFLWSALQITLWYTYAQTYGGYPPWLNSFQYQYISMRGFFADRATGFALEPSWLAHQLNMLYLPYWLAATLQRYSAHRFRVFGLTFENILLLGGAATLFNSHSRVGQVAFLMVIAYLAIQANLRLAHWLHTWFLNHIKLPAVGQRAFGLLLYAVLLAAFLAVYTAGTVGLAYVGSKVDPRLARLFDKPENPILSIDYANQLGFAERVVYWGVGWELFPDYPILGVGLGNAGYFFQEKLPAFGWALPEVNTVLFRSTTIPNTKSLWSRLLSETGLVGFAFFLAWAYVLWCASLTLRSHPDRLFRTIGLAGGLVLVALVAEGFSVDSFALPYWWISLGLLSAASRME